MRKLIATEYVTLDGVMEAPNKWSFPFWGEEAAKFKYDELFAADALLLGRTTYEGFATAWPTMEGTGDFGERMNSIEKFVVSTTLKKAEWENTSIISGNLAREITKLKAEPGKDILLSGSADLFNSLMQDDLIDEYRIMLHPVIAGQGKLLFDAKNKMKSLELVKIDHFITGIIVLHYLPKEK